MGSLGSEDVGRCGCGEGREVKKLGAVFLRNRLGEGPGAGGVKREESGAAVGRRGEVASGDDGRPMVEGGWVGEIGWVGRVWRHS